MFTLVSMPIKAQKGIDQSALCAVNGRIRPILLAPQGRSGGSSGANSLFILHLDALSLRHQFSVDEDHEKRGNPFSFIAVKHN